MTFRKPLTGSIFLTLLVVARLAIAQTPQPTPASQGQTQPTPAVPTPTAKSFAPQFKKTVAFLQVGYVDPISHNQMISGGTGFFVFYPDNRLGEGQGFLYLVTNRDVVQPGIEDGQPTQAEWMTLRVNPIDANKPALDEALAQGLIQMWRFPTDTSVDLAVLALLPDQKKYDFVPIPLSVFATKDVVDKEQIAEGDQVLFTGFFYQIPGMKRFEPIIREGALAMIPYEDLETTLHKSGRVYLADVRAFHGNSGSPLVVNVGGLRNGDIRAGFDYRLLGVVSGFYHEDADLKLTVATTLTGKLEENSGIAMVVPADAIARPSSEFGSYAGQLVIGHGVN